MAGYSQNQFAPAAQKLDDDRIFQWLVIPAGQDGAYGFIHSWGRMMKIGKWFGRLLGCRCGATGIEYALIAALVSASAVVTMESVGSGVGGLWSSSSSGLETASLHSAGQGVAANPAAGAAGDKKSAEKAEDGAKAAAKAGTPGKQVKRATKAAAKTEKAAANAEKKAAKKAQQADAAQAKADKAAAKAEKKPTAKNQKAAAKAKVKADNARAAADKAATAAAAARQRYQDAQDSLALLLD